MNGTIEPDDSIRCTILTETIRVNLHEESKRAHEERNGFIFWLDRIAEIKPKPPKVILAYLWKTPFLMNEDGVINPVFEHHDRLAAAYDFVVGHVNLASYMKEMKLDFGQAHQAFLADHHHPNPLGHAVLANLLLDFLRDETRVPKERLLAKKYTFEWACGNETGQKQLIQRLVQRRPHSSPLPVASFTNEHPKNPNTDRPGMVSPTKEMDTVLLGKVAPHRDDRQLSVPLPCCRGALDKSPTIDFAGQRPIRGEFRAFLLGIYEYSGGIRVHLDGQLASGAMVPAYEWPCLWNFRDVYHGHHWLALDAPWRNISTIGFCSVDSCCTSDLNAARGCTNLLSFALF